MTVPNYADQPYGATAPNRAATAADDHTADGMTYPSIDDLLTKSGSKYQLVLYAAKRARQINAYYAQLGEGLLEYVGPLVETHVQEKPLSVALREINADLLSYTPGADDPEPTVRPTLDAEAANSAFDDVLPDDKPSKDATADPFADSGEAAGETADQPADGANPPAEQG